MGSAREVAIFSKLLKTSNRSCCFSASCSSHFPLGSVFSAFLLLKSLEPLVTPKREMISRQEKGYKSILLLTAALLEILTNKDHLLLGSTGIKVKVSIFEVYSMFCFFKYNRLPYHLEGISLIKSMSDQVASCSNYRAVSYTSFLALYSLLEVSHLNWATRIRQASQSGYNWELQLQDNSKSCFSLVIKIQLLPLLLTRSPGHACSYRVHLT